MIYFTSDLHFYHENVIRYCNRPFADKQEMNAKLILNWNSRVKHDDIVYLLGDVSFGSAEQTKAILDQLNGRIFLCYGNHDQVLRKNAHLLERFEDVRDYYELKFQQRNGEGNMICMSHFPMLTWNKAHRGSFMLHGHSHGTMKYPFTARILDVGVDPQNYHPISIVEVERELLSRTLQVVDHHGKKDI